jgi:hypothetical protein
VLDRFQARAASHDELDALNHEINGAEPSVVEPSSPPNTMSIASRYIAFGGHSRTLAQPSAVALTPPAYGRRAGRVLVLSASGVRTLMRDVPSTQDKVLAALTARRSDD